jgi:competence protein ComEA
MGKKVFILIPLIFLVSFGIWFYNSVLSFKAKEPDVISYEILTYKVDLSGEVVFPQRYEVAEGTTLNQIIEYAGGFTKNADFSNLDITLPIYQDIKVVVLKNNVEDTLLVNINTSTFTELLAVPNLTENRAACIILYREQNGLFSSLDELINVKNIGPATLDKIKQYLTV